MIKKSKQYSRDQQDFLERAWISEWNKLRFQFCAGKYTCPLHLFISSSLNTGNDTYLAQLNGQGMLCVKHLDRAWSGWCDDKQNNRDYCSKSFIQASVAFLPSSVGKLCNLWVITDHGRPFNSLASISSPRNWRSLFWFWTSMVP